MKKEINSTSKRKWIAGGLAAFASIALLTTGFATWIVGINQTDQNANVTVNVDTVSNDSIKFTATLSDKEIRLAESTAVTTGFVRSDVETDGTGDKKPGDLQITFSTIKIEYGASADFKYNAIKFTLQPITTGEAPNQTTTSPWKVTENKIGGTYRADSTDGWTYITEPANITLPDATEDSTTGVKTITITGDDLTADFTWGTFFDSKSPCTYYNDIFNDPSSQTYENAGNVEAELKAMYTALNDKTLTLKAELVETTGN